MLSHNNTIHNTISTMSYIWCFAVGQNSFFVKKWRFVWFFSLYYECCCISFVGALHKHKHTFAFTLEINSKFCCCNFSEFSNRISVPFPCVFHFVFSRWYFANTTKIRLVVCQVHINIFRFKSLHERIEHKRRQLPRCECMYYVVTYAFNYTRIKHITTQHILISIIFLRII